MKIPKPTWVEVLLWLALACACFYIGFAKAEETTLTWTNPTEGETCTNAGPVTIDGVRIWELVADISDPSVEEYTISGLKPGSYTYVSTAYNADGESRLSGIATKTVTDFSVIDDRAYIVAKTASGFLLLVVGTVPVGTACDPDTEVNGFNSVPVEDVTFTGAEDVLVVAKCG